MLCNYALTEHTYGILNDHDTVNQSVLTTCYSDSVQQVHYLMPTSVFD